MNKLDLKEWLTYLVIESLGMYEWWDELPVEMQNEIRYRLESGTTNETTEKQLSEYLIKKINNVFK